MLTLMLRRVVTLKVKMHKSTLDLFKALIPPHKHTILLPVWRVAGFTLGLLPTLAGDRALFVTVEAVETFVEEHYHEQARGFSPAAQTPKPPG